MIKSLYFSFQFGCTPGSTPQAVFTSFKLPKPSPHSPDILGIQSSPGGLPPGLGSLQPLGLPPSLAGVPGMPPGLAAAAAGLGNFGGIPSSLTGVPSSLAGVQSSLGLPTSLSLQQASMMGIQTLASSNTGPTPSSVFLNHSIAKHIKPDSECILISHFKMINFENKFLFLNFSFVYLHLIFQVKMEIRVLVLCLLMKSLRMTMIQIFASLTVLMRK